MDQFREHELKKIREEERAKCQMELQSLRKEVSIPTLISSHSFFSFSARIFLQIQTGDFK